MRSRTHEIKMRLSDQERKHLDEMVARSNLPREVFLRKMIAGYQIKEAPPVDYFELMKQLRYIGNNIRQIAIRAHAIHDVDRIGFKEEADRLSSFILEMRSWFEDVPKPKRKEES